MKFLDVSDCDIWNKGAESLAIAASSSLEVLNISSNSIGDEGVTHIANALQTNTNMKFLNVSACDISDKGAESLARALGSLKELRISSNSIGDEGVAHIAIALQANTTMKLLDVSECDISNKGAKSLASVLDASSSLENLNISFSYLGDNGIAPIATALQANNTLKSLTWYEHFTNNATDKAALSLAAALKTNTSIQHMTLTWTSTRANLATTLRKMAKRIKKSALRELELYIVTPHMQSLGEPQVSLGEAKEWYRRVEIGGKEFILSLEDSRLKCFSIKHYAHYKLTSSVQGLLSKICMSLIEAAASVNSTRKKKHLLEIKFSICIE